eukprot:TRINITY_DN2620_c0_g1_i3.p1 TRINITY_DN2620_c0_g1~~TRINITY_DN2620_c0_g1_i3.p1  ORF type:complete len:517 (-),score=81.65 TRINITY_DN2620_c0_g1_i3:311-1729(-)
MGAKTSPSKYRFCLGNSQMLAWVVVVVIVVSVAAVYLLDYKNPCEGLVWNSNDCHRLRLMNRQQYLQQEREAEEKKLAKVKGRLFVNQSPLSTIQSIVPSKEESPALSENITQEEQLQQDEEAVIKQQLHEFSPGCYVTHPLQQKLKKSELHHDDDTKHLAGIITHHRMGTQMFSNMLFLYADRVGFSYQLTVGSQNLGGGTKPDFQSIRLLSDTRLVSAQHGLDECCDKDVAVECPMFNVTCKMDACKLLPPPKTVHWSLVHVVRNPVEIIMSSYLYHNQENPPEPWLHKAKPELMPLLFPDDEERQQQFQDAPYYQILNQVEPAIGLRAEIIVNLEEILQMATNHRDVLELPHAKNYRFEDIMSDVVGESREILKYLGLFRDHTQDDSVDRYLKKNFDLATMRSDRKSEAMQHVTEGKFNKTELAQLMYDQEDLREVMEEVGNRVGYEDPFSRLHKSTVSSTSTQAASAT